MSPRNLFIGGIALSISCWLISAAISDWLDTPTEAPINFSNLHGEGLTQWVSVVVHSSGTQSVGVKFGTLSDAPPESCLKAALPKSSWVLFQQTDFGEKISQPWARSSFDEYEAWQYGELGRFEAHRGSYALQILFPREIACLERWRPRIVVNSPVFDTYQELGGLFSLVLRYFGLAGLALLPLAFFVWIRSVSFAAGAPLIFPGLGSSNSIRFRRQRLTPIRLNLPDFGLYWGIVLWVPMIIFMTMNPSAERGFTVPLQSRAISRAQESPYRDSLEVYARADGAFMINGRAFAQNAFYDALLEELKHRPYSTVYFEADENVTVSSAYFAMDVIKRAGGDLVWITPQIRKELNAKAHSTPSN